MGFFFAKLNQQTCKSSEDEETGAKTPHIPKILFRKIHFHRKHTFGEKNTFTENRLSEEKNFWKIHFGKKYFWKNALVRSCLLITLFKCLKGHKLV